jgi:hypothetical protein
MANLTVGPTSAFATIAAAMAVAIAGDTLLIEAGYGNEAATVTQSGLTISGGSSSTGIVLELATGVTLVTLAGTAPIDVIDAGDSSTIAGNDGNNVISVSSGVDVVNAGAGDDRLIINYGAATVAITGTPVGVTDGATHAVTFTGVEHFTITTGSGADTITVGDGDNILNTGGAADTITAGNGANVIDGESGNDTIVAGDGGNIISGGDGNDGITTGIGDDVVIAGLGNDTVITGGGADVATVNGGIDTVDGGTQSDRLVVDYSSSTTVVSGGVTTGTFAGGYAGAYADAAGTSSVGFAGIENFTIAGGSASDVIGTGDGDDDLDGGAGNDQLNSGGGNDVLVVGVGNDALDGGDGADAARFSGARANYQISDLGNGFLQTIDVRSGSPDGTDTFTNIEAFVFTDGTFDPVTVLVVAPTTLVSNLAFSADTGPSNSDFITRTAAQTISGTLSANLASGETVEVSLNGGGSWATATSTIGTSTFALAGQTLVGDNVLMARVTNLSGDGSIFSQVYVLDATAPGKPSAPSLTLGSDSGAPGDGITNDATPTVTGTAEAGSTVTLYDTDGTTVLGTAVANGSGDYSITSSALTAGGHTLLVHATDMAGNVGAFSSGFAITIDTSAPAQPATPILTAFSDSGTLGDGTTNDSTPTVTGAAEAGSTVRLYDTDGTTVLGSAVANGVGDYSITSALLTAGSHILSVQATDTAGNPGVVSSGLAIMIDTSAPGQPSTPTLVVASDGGTLGDGITNDATPTVIGTAEVGSTVTLYDTDGTTVLGTAVANGSGDYSITSTTLASGSHSLLVQATDAAGNSGAFSLSFAITVDTAAPVQPGAPVLAAVSDSGTLGDGSTNATTPTVTGTAEAGSTVTLYDTDGTTVLGSGVANGSGDYSMTSTVLTTGNHTLLVRATDAAGNTGIASFGLTIKIDTAAPGQPSTPTLAVASDSGAVGDGITNETSPTLSGTAEAGSTVRLYDTDGTTVLGSAVASGTGDYSITSSALTAGSHTLLVRATDAAGNAGAFSSGFAITIDTAAPGQPSTPTLLPASDSGTLGDGTTNDATPTVTGTAEVGSTVTLYDTDGTTVLGTALANGSGYSIISTALTAGDHTLLVQATDAAGNSGAFSSGLAIKIDTAAPGQPSILGLAAASDSGTLGDGITIDTTPTLTGTAEAGSAVTLYDTGGTTVLGSGVANGSGDYSITSSTLTAGSHTLLVRVTDAAGNTGPFSSGFALTIDTAAPGQPSVPALITASDSGTLGDGITGDTTPTVTGSAEAGSRVTLYDTDGTTVLGSGVANGTGDYSITSTAITAGSHTLLAQAKDAAGNVGVASSGLTIMIDTSAPGQPSAPALVVVSDTGALGDDLTSDTTPTVTGTAEAGSTVTLYDTDGTTVLGSGVASGSGDYGITSTALASGNHTLLVKATDAAGNTGAFSSGLTLSIDATAPGQPSTPTLTAASDSGALGDGITSDTTPTVTGTAEAGSSVTLYDTNGTTVLGTAVVNGSGDYSITSSTLTAGGHTLVVRATDAAGNAGAFSSGLAVTIDTSAPAQPSTPVLTAGSDSGTLGDGITSDTTPAVTGTAEAGSTVTLYDSDGTTMLGSAVANGSGDYSITSTTLSAGIHSVRVQATDTAGNVGAPSVALVLTIDTSVPGQPSTPTLVAASDSGTPGDGSTNDATPRVTGTAEAGSTVTLYDADGTTVLGTTVANGSGDYSITSTALSAGVHSLRVQATDVAGSVGVASAALAITIDTSAPGQPSVPGLAATSDSGTLGDGSTNDTTPTVTGTAEAGSTVTLYDTDGTTVLGTSFANGNGDYSITSTALTAGSHTLSLKSTDAAANTSLVSFGFAIMIDSSAPGQPSAPALTSASDSGTPGDNQTNVASPAVTGTAEARSTVTLYDTDGTTVLGAALADATTGAYNITSSALSVGVHTLTVKAADLSANISTASAGLAVTIDTAAPTLAITSNVSQLKTGESAAITFTFSKDPGSSFSWDGSSGDVTLSGGTLSPIAGSGLVRTAIFTPTANTNGGTASITVAAGAYTDDIGNDGTAGVTPSLHFDTLAPDAPSTPNLASVSDSGVSIFDNLTGVTTPTFGGTAATGSTVTLYDTDGITALGATIASAGTWSITASALGEGLHAISARTTDAAGNRSAPSLRLLITIDTTAPAGPGVILARDTGVSSADHVTSNPQITYNADNGSALLYKADGAVSYSTTAPVFAADGAHALLVAQQDNAGNISTPTSLSFTLDTAAPTVSVTADRSALLNGQTAMVTFTFSQAITNFALSDTSVTGGALSNLSHTGLIAGSDIYTATFSPDSIHSETGSVQVDASVYGDSAGNLSAASNTLTFSGGTVAPGAPTPVLVHDTGASATDHVTNNSQIAYSPAEAGGSLLYMADDAASFSSVVPTFTTEGLHTVQVEQQDAAGNVGPAANFRFTLDTIAPHLTGITADSPCDNNTSGSTVHFTLDFNEAIDVTGGTPALTLNNGASAVYNAEATAYLHDATKMAFDYLVSASDAATPSLAVTGFDSHGATVDDRAGNHTNLTDVDVATAFAALSVNEPGGTVIAAFTINGVTRPELHLNTTGQIILDEVATHSAEMYGLRFLYLGVPENTPYPPVADSHHVCDCHLM